MVTDETEQKLSQPLLVLLDRDGVINREIGRSVKSVPEFEFVPGTFEALKKLQAAGAHMAVVTNQASVGRGDLSPEGLDEIHEYMKSTLKEQGITLNTIFVCTDVSDESHRRKPNPGMVEEALVHFGIQPDHTHMIGDHIRDLQAADKKGCHRHLVLTGHGATYAQDPKLKNIGIVHIHADLQAAVDHILKSVREG